MMVTSTSSCSPASSISATKASWTFMEPANTQAVPAHTETRRLPSRSAETATLTPSGRGAGRLRHRRHPPLGAEHHASRPSSFTSPRMTLRVWSALRLPYVSSSMRMTGA